MTYEEKCKALGIERPRSLADRFPDTPNGALEGKIQGIHNLPMGQRPAVRAQLEDLSYLNPACGKRRQKQSKKWWGKMTLEERRKHMEQLSKNLGGRTKKSWWSKTTSYA